MTYSLWYSSLLWLGRGLGLSGSLWLCNFGDLWLRGSLGLGCGLRFLCGCGLLDNGLLLSLGLLGLRLGNSWLRLLLGKLGSSRASCEFVRRGAREIGWQTHTLWLSEDTLLDTRLKSTVEQRIEHGVGGGDLVVGLDILL
jgi:hypothetical protein